MKKYYNILNYPTVTFDYNAVWLCMGYNLEKADDRWLWELIKQQSDQAAFAELHRRFSQQLYTLASRKTGDQQVAQDLVQDLFIALWDNRFHITIEKAVNLYLFSAIKNRIISHLRKQMIRKAIPLDELDAETLLKQSSNFVDDWVSLKELEEQYAYELSNLPEKSREVFALSRSGLSNKEIARMQGVTQKTIEFHISKCLRILREKIGYLSMVMILCS
ncbi:RNA polymerase sigma-70 factor [Dyadobacter psychrotolerans]|uniref:RNA polymerase sigma-70 factor n=1 Tax=Dyadobacter psychrotolerans TaxID=2541721 RepID=A0A4R5DFG7_9BACT|nr:RNA polymerase sigma-70 factor [Dyadobacter psychrotolerans]TDE10504.1 RNA polymerase sigma-70 factor [Dyadobacter psychrotolerans]